MLARLQQAPPPAPLAADAPTEPLPAPSRWTLRTIAATFDWLKDYSLSGVWRVLKAYKLGLHSARVQLYSPDPAYAEKLDRLLACLAEVARQPDTTTLLFMDEMSFHRWPDTARDWSGAADEARRVAHRAGPNNRQHRLIGALNALTGRVDYLDRYIVGRDEVIALYQRLHEVYPQAQRLYLVQDNWSIHHHPYVRGATATFKRIEPVWLPTYAPWLNPIEKLWRWLRGDVLKLHRCADDWDGLLRRVRSFLDQFAKGSPDLLRYVGLSGDGRLARALRLT